MPDRTEVRTGTCAEHGRVEATRTVPGVHFPFVVWAFRRAATPFRAFRCPHCDNKVKVGSGS